VLALLGVGRKAAEASIARLFAEWNPAAIALVGTAGGCVPEARAGDLFLVDPQRVEPEAGPNGRPIEGRAPIPASRAVVDAVLRAAAASDARVTLAPGITVGVPAATTAAKESLGRNRGVALCEMEGFWLARACLERGVPFASVRAIFDGVMDPLPFVPGLGTDPLLQVLGRRPSFALHLPRLGLRMWKVRRRLDPFARALVSEMAGIA